VVFPLEFHHVLGVCASKGIDALIAITHHEEILCSGFIIKELDDPELYDGGVLKLIDQDMFP